MIAASLPSAPGIPTNTAASKTSITVGWTAATDNGSPVINYAIYYSVNSGSFTTLDINVGALLTYTVSGLSEGNNYKFKVQAQNGVGQGDLSNESAVIIAAVVPNAPTAVSRVYGDGSVITIDW